MGKMRLQEALEIEERDSIGQCYSCTGLAMEGDVYCSSCKDYWENDCEVFNRLEKEPSK